jgi:drug/metabolite transporter (DMT)-like permease
VLLMLVLLLVARVIWGVVGSIAGVVSAEFSYRGFTVRGTGPRVMSSSFIFFALAGLRAVWMLRGGTEWVKQDWLVRALLLVAAATLGGGFVLFFLSIAF